MQAYKCDRCGGFYEERPVEVLSEISRIFDRHVYGIAFECTSRTYSLDLCSDCLAEFKAWYESGAAVKEQMK